MTDQTQPADLDSACEQLDELCAKVGLMRAKRLPDAENAATAPNGTALWASPYARLLLWPCSASDPESLESSARAGQDWFDEVLVNGERQAGGRPIDGYLVLALPVAPDDNVREDVRRLELSAQVCRKHLIWPSSPNDADHEPGRWRRVADVTVLGLPDAELTPGAELQWPRMDSEAQALWDNLTSLGVAAMVIKDNEA